MDFVDGLERKDTVIFGVVYGLVGFLVVFLIVMIFLLMMRWVYNDDFLDDDMVGV